MGLRWVALPAFAASPHPRGMPLRRCSCAWQDGTELRALGGVRTHVRFVSPLYLHLFPATEVAPSIAFIGLPWKIVPFPQMELQARLVAR